MLEREALLALDALVGPLAGMQQQVCVQAVLVGEGLAAVVARVRLDARVGLLVRGEVVLEEEGLAALMAGKRAHLRAGLLRLALGLHGHLVPLRDNLIVLLGRQLYGGVGRDEVLLQLLARPHLRLHEEHRLADLHLLRVEHALDGVVVQVLGGVLRVQLPVVREVRRRTHNCCSRIDIGLKLVSQVRSSAMSARGAIRSTRSSNASAGTHHRRSRSGRAGALTHSAAAPPTSATSDQQPGDRRRAGPPGAPNSFTHTTTDSCARGSHCS